MRKNIVLIGMPGSGKSVIGKLLSQKLKYPLYDIDAMIVNGEKKAISEIMKNGEDHFRKIETIYVKMASTYCGCILATGGGVILKEENMNYLKENGIVVYINRPLEDIKKQKSISKRPLIGKDLSAVDKLYNQRHSLYEKYADITITNEEAIEDTVNNIVNKLEENNFI